MNITSLLPAGFLHIPSFLARSVKDLARTLHSNDFLLLCAGGSAMSPFCCVKPLPWSWDGENGENPQEIWGSWGFTYSSIGKILFFLAKTYLQK
jgi:hypothetical protein